MKRWGPSHRGVNQDLSESEQNIGTGNKKFLLMLLLVTVPAAKVDVKEDEGLVQEVVGKTIELSPGAEKAYEVHKRL